MEVKYRIELFFFFTIFAFFPDNLKITLRLTIWSFKNTKIKRNRPEGNFDHYPIPAAQPATLNQTNSSRIKQIWHLLARQSKHSTWDLSRPETTVSSELQIKRTPRSLKYIREAARRNDQPAEVWEEGAEGAGSTSTLSITQLVRRSRGPREAAVSCLWVGEGERSSF